MPWPDVTGFLLVRTPLYNSRWHRDARAVAVLRAVHAPLYCFGSSFVARSPQADEMVRALESERQAIASGS